MTTAFNWSDYITERLADSFDLPTSALEIPTAPIIAALSKALHTSTLTLDAERAAPISKEEAGELFQSNCSGSLYLPSLGGSITWILSDEMMRKLFSKLLRKSLAGDESLAPDLVRGVQQVLAAQVLAALTKVGFAPIHGALIQESRTPDESGALYPIICKADDEVISLQLFAPYSLLTQIEKRPAKPTPELLQSLRAALSLEIGSVSLSYGELKTLSHGDCLLLDRCTLDPMTYHGTMTFTLHGKAFFRAKLKGNECKLLDYPFDAIGESPMDDIDPNEINPSKNRHQPENDTPWLEGEAESIAHMPAAEPVEQAKVTLAADQIPLDLKVELGHIEMSAARIAELAPGQVLDLGIRPEQGVECTIGGKRVAKGLLVKIGEMIGVRITEIK